MSLCSCRLRATPLLERQNDRTRDRIGDTETAAEVFQRSRNESSVAIMFGLAFASASMSVHSAMMQ